MDVKLLIALLREKGVLLLGEERFSRLLLAARMRKMAQ